MTEYKKIIENNFDHMREVISNTRLPINVGDTTVGEATLREGDVFRLATALINEGFRLEHKGEWLTDKYGMERSICSLCGSVYEGDGGNYCRNCGARMTDE